MDANATDEPDDEDEDLPPDPIDTMYLHASGWSHDECAYLGQRYSRRWGYRARSGEMWVLRHGPAPGGGTVVSHHHPTDTRYAAIWLAPGGRVFVADATLCCVHSAVLVQGVQDAWSRSPLPMAVQGIWGLADDFVLAWGGSGDRFPMCRFDGRGWRAMADPGFEVYAVHGIAPDRLVAVGVAGQLAHFDGDRWQTGSTPVGEVLTGVWMVGPDEVYACGAGGALLEASRSRVAQIAQALGGGAFPLFDVAWWRDELWIAGGRLGLLRRTGRTDVLAVVDTKLLGTGGGPTRLDARRDLVVTYPDRIASTRDGEIWSHSGRDSLADTYADRPLHFYR